jgi:hypothetical protein
MPSMHRPSWRGVSSFPSEQDTVSYITERLERLERSTSLIRENLDNLISTSAIVTNASSVPMEIQPLENDNEIITTYLHPEAHELPDLKKLDKDVQLILERNETLKQQVSAVLESNAQFKLEMKEYLEQDSKWKMTFLEESKRLEDQLHLVVVQTPQILNDHSMGDDSFPLTKRVKKFWKLAGSILFYLKKVSRWKGLILKIIELLDTYSRKTFANLRDATTRKAFSIIDAFRNYNHDGPYSYQIVPNH